MKNLSPSRVWLLLAVVYGAFFYWYTSFDGPLTQEEIDHYIELFEEREGTPEDITRMRQFMENDTGDDFLMVNVSELRDPPGQVEGTPPAKNAEEQIGRYMEFMFPQLLRRGCHPVLLGFAAGSAMDLMGLDGVDDIETWTSATMMRYRSRRDLLEIGTNPEFEGRHDFKVAGIAKTIAYPVDPWFHFGDPRILLALFLLVVGLLWQVLWVTRVARG